VGAEAEYKWSGEEEGWKATNERAARKMQCESGREWRGRGEEGDEEKRRKGKAKKAGCCYCR